MNIVFPFVCQIHEFTYGKDLPTHWHPTDLCSWQVWVRFPCSQLWTALIHGGPKKSRIFTKELILVTFRNILCITQLTVDKLCPRITGRCDGHTNLVTPDNSCPLTSVVGCPHRLWTLVKSTRRQSCLLWSKALPNLCCFYWIVYYLLTYLHWSLMPLQGA